MLIRNTAVSQVLPILFSGFAGNTLLHAASPYKTSRDFNLVYDKIEKLQKDLNENCKELDDTCEDLHREFKAQNTFNEAQRAFNANISKALKIPEEMKTPCAIGSSWLIIRTPPPPTSRASNK